MRRLCAIFACSLLLLAACAPKPAGTWRATCIRSDGPALGMELHREGRTYTGAMYLMDPDTPNDFAAARSFPMVIKSADDYSIHFQVEFRPHEPDDLVLRLASPVDGEAFHGILVTTNGLGNPMEFNFERVYAK